MAIITASAAVTLSLGVYVAADSLDTTTLTFPASIKDDIDVLDGLEDVRFRKRGAPTTTGGKVSYPDEINVPVPNVHVSMVGIRAAEASGGKYLASDRRFRVRVHYLPAVPDDQWEIIDDGGGVWRVLQVDDTTWDQELRIFARR